MSAALGLDIGSSNVKIVLLDQDGSMVGSAQRPLATSRDGSAVEQDAAETWTQIVAGTRELTSNNPGVASRVGVIGVCSQYSSIVPVDAEAKPVGPMIMWSDHRGTDLSWGIIGRNEEAFATWIDRHGIPPVGGGLALAHIPFLQHERPEIHAVTTAYLEPMDYVTARLTGRITATQHSMFMSQLCDNRTLDVQEYDQELVELSGVDPDRLPPLIGIDQEVGTLSGPVASRLGLPVTAKVYAGSNDTAMLGLAAGVGKPGRGGLAIGTTSVLVDSVAKKNTDLDHEILAMPALSLADYLVFAENGNGGRVIEFMLDQLIHANDVLADHRTDQLFARLDDALMHSKPGAGGSLFLPWLGGSLAPSANPMVRGGFINVSFQSQRVDLLRAVAEGVAHNLAWLLPHVEAFTGNRIEELVFVGGAARSPAWCQILADILARPLLSAVEPETAVARSVARLALARSGALDRAAVETGLDPDDLAHRYEPQLENRPVHELHQEQFEAAFEALRPISETLTAFHSTDE